MRVEARDRLERVGVALGVALLVVAVVGGMVLAVPEPAPVVSVPVTSVPGPVARAEDDYVYEWVDGAYTIEDTVTGVEFIIIAPEGTYDVDWTGSDWILRPVE